MIRFNQQGPDGLINIPSPGVPPKLGKKHRAFLVRLVEEGPNPSGARRGALSLTVAVAAPAKFILEPIFEADFTQGSFRRRCSWPCLHFVPAIIFEATSSILRLATI